MQCVLLLKWPFVFGKLFAIYFLIQTQFHDGETYIGNNYTLKTLTVITVIYGHCYNFYSSHKTDGKDFYQRK